MVDKTPENLTAISDANAKARTWIMPVQRSGQIVEKMTPAQLDLALSGSSWPYISGWYYEASGMAPDLASTSTMANGNLYAVIGELLHDVTIDSLAIKTSATVTGSGNAKLGIASVDPATMKPKTTLGVTGNISIPTANTPYGDVITGGAILVPKGLIALLSSVDSSHSMVAPAISLVNSSLAMQRLGSSTRAGAFTTMARSGWSASSAFGTIPSDLTTLTWSEDTSSRGAKVKFLVA